MVDGQIKAPAGSSPQRLAVRVATAAVYAAVG